MRYTLIFTVLLLTLNFIYSQTNKYFIAFKNKNNNGYSVSNPSAFLSNRSIQRRINQNIPIDDTDLPVTPSYVSQIASLSGVTVLHRLKWLNGIVIQTTNTAALSVIQSYTYVQSAQPLNSTTHPQPIDTLSSYTPLCSSKTYSLNYANMYDQIHQLKVECLHNAGYKGEGLIIAVIDDGFYNVQNNPVFDSLLAQGRLLGTRDFVTGDTMVFEDDAHGAYVLSVMAALAPGNMIGTAPKSSYWLLRSEDINAEYPAEEYYWIRAAEFADSAGADVINTSLGYTTFDNSAYNHTYAMLNGTTTPIAKAAKMAAQKGMFVCIAAGNEGSSSWYYISTPADADNVCTVGAVDINGTPANFSGHGPTSDGRIKPDVCAMGVNTTISSANGFAFNSNGTSLAAPLIAGAAACLWQAKPNLNNSQLLSLIKQSSSHATNPNNTIGWGIPDFCSALTTISDYANLPNVQLYPNPFSNEIHIKSSSLIQRIYMTNLLGQLVFETQSVETNHLKIQASHLPKGLYFVHLQDIHDHLWTYKLIK